MALQVRKIRKKIVHTLSRRPGAYALIVGIGIVLFWRGVWHSADYLHTLFQASRSYSALSSPAATWWDGPLSLFAGSLILWLTGAFTSSFIGNELILSGLKGEKRLSERTERNLKNEVVAISEIKDELIIISKKLEILESKARENHQKI